MQKQELQHFRSREKKYQVDGEKGFGRILEIFLVLGGHNMGIHFDINHSGYFSLGVLQFSIKAFFYIFKKLFRKRSFDFLCPAFIYTSQSRW